MPLDNLQPMKRVFKRSQDYGRARDVRCLQAWIAKREAKAQVIQSQLGSLESIKMVGGYVGRRGGVEGAGDEFFAVIIIPDHEGRVPLICCDSSVRLMRLHRSAARIVDRTGLMFAFRACKGVATDAANSCAQAAAAFLAESQIPPSERNGKRGDFDQFYFILHRESQPVSLNCRVVSSYVLRFDCTAATHAFLLCESCR